MSTRTFDRVSQVTVPDAVFGTAKVERFELRLVAQPIGSFSLAGAQMKVSAREVPHLVCSTDGCGFTKAASSE